MCTIIQYIYIYTYTNIYSYVSERAGEAGGAACRAVGLARGPIAIAITLTSTNCITLTTTSTITITCITTTTIIIIIVIYPIGLPRLRATMARAPSSSRSCGTCPF